jgi:hypothetical protein
MGAPMSSLKKGRLVAMFSMEVKPMRKHRIALAAVLLPVLLTFGCSFDRISPQIPQKTGSGFLKKEFLDGRRVAILPFDGDSKGEAADAFALSFREKFPNIDVVDRKETQGVLKEQTFSPGWPDEATRRRIGKTLKADAVVAGSVYYPSIARWLLQVRIIDVETGSWVGQSSVEIGFAGDLGLKEGCRLAVESLVQR